MAHKPRVLIVDDNISLCKTLSFVLKRKDCTVVIAKDGLEAMARIEDASFDVIFMDIKMPQVDGVEICRRVKAARPEIVVVMMTAYAVDDLVQEAIDAGAYKTLYKPLDIEEVLALIGEVVVS